MRILFALFSSLLILPASAAEIYRYTDAQGNTVFTNQPPVEVDSQAVTLPPANTLPSAESSAYPTPADNKAPDRVVYQQLELTGLPDADAIRANNGSFSVQVAIEPELSPGHMLRLLLNGQPYGEAGTATAFQVINIDRGSHTLAVEVIRGERSIQRSSPVTIHVQRVSR